MGRIFRRRHHVITQGWHKIISWKTDDKLYKYSPLASLIVYLTLAAILYFMSSHRQHGGSESLEADDFLHRSGRQLLEEHNTTASTTTKRHGPAWEQCDMEQSSKYENLWAVHHLWWTFYSFIGLAVVCDDFFVPSLEIISEKMRLSEDVAGATFMAAGSSAPELFTSVAGVAQQSDVGVGTIVGSAVFNVLVIISLTGALAGKVLLIDWRPLCRDLTFYAISIIVFIAVAFDGLITWYEACILLLLYSLYITVMVFNPRLMEFMNNKLCCKPEVNPNEDEVAHVTVDPVDHHVEIRRGSHQEHDGPYKKSRPTMTKAISCTFVLTKLERGHSHAYHPFHTQIEPIGIHSPSGLNTPGRVRSRRSMQIHPAHKPSSIPDRPRRASSALLPERKVSSPENPTTEHDVTNTEKLETHVQLSSPLVTEALPPTIIDQVMSHHTQPGVPDHHQLSHHSHHIVPSHHTHRYMQSHHGYTLNKTPPSALSIQLQRASFTGGHARRLSLHAALHATAAHSKQSLNQVAEEGTLGACQSNGATRKDSGFSDDKESGHRPRSLTADCDIRRPQGRLPPISSSVKHNAKQSGAHGTTPSTAASNAAPNATQGITNNLRQTVTPEIPPYKSISETQMVDNQDVESVLAEKEAEADNVSITQKGLVICPHRCCPVIKSTPPKKPHEDTGVWSKFIYALKWILYVLAFPFYFLCTFTIPDCSKDHTKKWYIASFLLSVAWIAALSFAMVTLVGRTGCILGIDEYTMGLVVIAVGTSVPDCLSSILVARDGFGDMAVSNALGSNVFDIDLGLGLPFLIRILIQAGAPIFLLDDHQKDLHARGLLPIIPHVKFGFILLGLLGIIAALFTVARFKLNRLISVTFILLYIAFLVYAFVQEVYCDGYQC